MDIHSHDRNRVHGGGVPGGLSVPALIGKLQKKLAEQMTDKIENIT